MTSDWCLWAAAPLKGSHLHILLSSSLSPPPAPYPLLFLCGSQVCRQWHRSVVIFPMTGFNVKGNVSRDRLDPVCTGTYTEADVAVSIHQYIKKHRLYLFHLCSLCLLSGVFPSAPVFITPSPWPYFSSMATHTHTHTQAHTNIESRCEIEN